MQKYKIICFFLIVHNVQLKNKSTKHCMIKAWYLWIGKNLKIKMHIKMTLILKFKFFIYYLSNVFHRNVNHEIINKFIFIIYISGGIFDLMIHFLFFMIYYMFYRIHNVKKKYIYSFTIYIIWFFSISIQQNIIIRYKNNFF